MFPSSFSIAALIGAAAIRNQVATKLGLNVETEENEEKSEEERVKSKEQIAKGEE